MMQILYFVLRVVTKFWWHILGRLVVPSTAQSVVVCGWPKCIAQTFGGLLLLGPDQGHKHNQKYGGGALE